MWCILASSQLSFLISPPQKTREKGRKFPRAENKQFWAQWPFQWNVIGFCVSQIISEKETTTVNLSNHSPLVGQWIIATWRESRRKITLFAQYSLQLNITLVVKITEIIKFKMFTRLHATLKITEIMKFKTFTLLPYFYNQFLNWSGIRYTIIISSGQK